MNVKLLAHAGVEHANAAEATQHTASEESSLVIIGVAVIIIALAIALMIYGSKKNKS